MSCGSRSMAFSNALADVGIVHRRDEQGEGEADEEQQEREAGEQDQRLQPVVPDVGLEAVGAEHGPCSGQGPGGAAGPRAAQNFTCGAASTAARSPSSTSKKVRWVKPIGPATSTIGNGLDGGVELLHGVVEEAPGGGDLVLEVGEVRLELQEVLVGLEVGIGLGQRRRAGGARRSACSPPWPGPRGRLARRRRCAPG